MEDGVYTDLSITDYHANKTHISSTGIKYIKKSLKHFDWFHSGKFDLEEKPHFSFGNAFELALLDHVGFEKDVAIAQTEYWAAQVLKDRPDIKRPKQTKEYEAYESKFKFDNKSKLYEIPDVGDQSFETIEQMLISCKQDATIQRLIEGTDYQTSIFWTDPETGIKLKTRPDMNKRKKNVIVNLKTTLDGSPEGFTKDLKKWDYPLQACVEISGCLRTGIMDKVDNYFWLVVEKVPPFNATIYEFQETDIMAVMDSYDFLLSRIKKAQEQNKYPGYSDQADNEYGILQAKLPAWYKF